MSRLHLRLACAALVATAACPARESAPPPWKLQLGTPAADFARGVATDAAGGVYVAGYTTGALDGAVAGGDADLFVAKYDVAGARLWTRQLGTTSSVTMRSSRQSVSG